MKQQYDDIAEQYLLTDLKPDKRYSIIPTLVSLVGDLTRKTVLDAGCGSGLFTRLFSRSAQTVYGWDSSKKQLGLARQNTPLPRRNIHYQQKNIFIDQLPQADVIHAPFVMNYAHSAEELGNLFKRFHDALHSGGRIVSVVDLPSGRDLRQLGATKKLLGPKKDGTSIEIITFDSRGERICPLPLLAHYYPRSTFETVARQAGLTLLWRRPIISAEGLADKSIDWSGYLEDPELGYFVAHKK